MKRLKFLIPLLLLVVVVFAGCSSTAANTTAETAADTVTKTTAALIAVISPTSEIVVDPEFTDRDVNTSYDDAPWSYIKI